MQKLSYILHCGLLRSFTAQLLTGTNQKTRRGNGAKANCLHPVSFCRGFGLPAGQEDDQSLQDMGLKPAPTLSARFLGTLHACEQRNHTCAELSDAQACSCLSSNFKLIHGSLMRPTPESVIAKASGATHASSEYPTCFLCQLQSSHLPPPCHLFIGVA